VWDERYVDDKYRVACDRTESDWTILAGGDVTSAPTQAMERMFVVTAGSDGHSAWMEESQEKAPAVLKPP
jgi:hypothetical protein